MIDGYSQAISHAPKVPIAGVPVAIPGPLPGPAGPPGAPGALGGGPGFGALGGPAARYPVSDLQYAQMLLFIYTNADVDIETLRTFLQDSPSDVEKLDRLDKSTLFLGICQFEGLTTVTLRAYLPLFFNLLVNPSLPIDARAKDFLDDYFTVNVNGAIEIKETVAVVGQEAVISNFQQRFADFTFLKYQAWSVESEYVATIYYLHNFIPVFVSQYAPALRNHLTKENTLRGLEKQALELSLRIYQGYQGPEQFINTAAWALAPVNSGVIRFTVSASTAFEQVFYRAVDVMKGVGNLTLKPGASLQDDAVLRELSSFMVEDSKFSIALATAVGIRIGANNSTASDFSQTKSGKDQTQSNILASLNEFKKYRIFYDTVQSTYVCERSNTMRISQTVKNAQRIAQQLGSY
jgi:hypothetical protein